MLNYRRFGSGKTVVLQHGFAGGGEYFAPLSAHLELSEVFNPLIARFLADGKT